MKSHFDMSVLLETDCIFSEQFTKNASGWLLLYDVIRLLRLIRLLIRLLRLIRPEAAKATWINAYMLPFYIL